MLEGLGRFRLLGISCPNIDTVVMNHLLWYELCSRRDNRYKLMQAGIPHRRFLFGNEVRRMVSRVLSVLLLLLVPVPPLVAQELSEREEIAIFDLSYYGEPEPREPRGPTIRVEVDRDAFRFEYRGTGDESYDREFARQFDAVNDRINGVFVELGRFDVIGYSQRLTAESVDEFVELLREFKEDRIEVPEEVLLGRQPFTEAELERLTGGFIVVVPSITYYGMSRSEGEYTAEVETSLTFIDVDTTQTMDHIRIETSGTDEEPGRAIRSAVERIPPRLSTEVRTMEAFLIRSGVIDVDGRDVHLEFGRNMGVVRGDEYVLLDTDVTAAGRERTREIAFLVVREVHQSFSIARLVYADRSPSVGDQAEEVPRTGAELGVYTHGVTPQPLTGEGGEAFSRIDAVVIGLETAAARGFYGVRPVVGVELPIIGAPNHLVCNGTLGVEFPRYIGRVRVTPAFHAGAGAAIRTRDDEEDPFLSHLGGRVQLGVEYFATRNVLFRLEGGATRYWESGRAHDKGIPGYGGLYVGAGLRLK